MRTIQDSGVTRAARLIAREHNARLKAGFGGNGFLVFSHDGSGGQWYSSGFGFRGMIIIRMRWDRITAGQAQAVLDGRGR